ncbi:MAG: GNAT family N-acetyltransferase [Flavobacteriaceae bacterium]
MTKEIIDFYFGLFERGVLPELYSNISYSHNNIIISRTEWSEEKSLSANKPVSLVKYVPEYLKPHLKKHLKAIKFFEIKGYAITLNGVTSIEEYLAEQIKRKLRISLLNRKKRLEQCFNIRYEVFHNHITKEEYSILMEALRKLLVRRFEQRNEVNERLLDWNKYYDLFFTLINTKKASLFVIYESNKPIALSLNYHFDKVFFGAISSYDIDYGKFGLGQILVYKRLEWCIEQKFDVFDMSMGNPDYKKKWCNTVYDFEHHIVYSPDSLSSSFYAKSIAIRMRTKMYLKSKNIHILYKKIKTNLKVLSKNDKEPNNTRERIKYTIEPENNIKTYNNLTKVDYNTSKFSFLKQYACEFLYVTKEHILNTEIFEVEKERIYVIKGKDHSSKVIFEFHKNAKA